MDEKSVNWEISELQKNEYSNSSFPTSSSNKSIISDLSVPQIRKPAGEELCKQK